ncbi:AraC-like DNA-binding protein [Granulicella aggregans]|uniref:AraC-like DNA-binding protein n=1 Tax=Granulicella aggregans TaxID=474949 RepID=A0A7W7ZDX3_9BACT|nr:AraC family transcriptional regulator [Granulicella aggregans]MBB5058088.1 AraC-like DNA-binding protein [Granulicella aggregans]
MQTSSSHKLDGPRLPISFTGDPEMPTFDLRLSHRSPGSEVAEGSEPFLIVIVNLYPASVKQQWSTGLSAPADRPLLADSSIGKNHKYRGVRYHVPSDTLDHCAKLHGLNLAAIEIKTKMFRCPIFNRLTHLFLASIESPIAVAPAFMDHFATLFSAQLLHAQLPASNQFPARGGLTARQKRQIGEVFDENGRENASLPQLAGRCGLSVSHFARSFKISFGTSVHQWIIAQRIERSKELLLNSDIPLIEIAFLAGFCDQASFNRAFAKITGETPGRWRSAGRCPRG